MHTIYDFDALSIDGKPVALEQFRGRPMLIVNTASACGFTPQFGGLEQLHQTYGARGLVVLGFPCNQFGSQDPGSNEDIATFCQRNFGVSFPMMSKIDVNGPEAHPLYQWLTAEAPGLPGASRMRRCRNPVPDLAVRPGRRYPCRRDGASFCPSCRWNRRIWLLHRFRLRQGRHPDRVRRSRRRHRPERQRPMRPALRRGQGPQLQNRRHWHLRLPRQRRSGQARPRGPMPLRRRHRHL
mgnify:CR=1 FL=1